MTRITELMVKESHLISTTNNVDIRRFNLNIIAKGQKTIKELSPIIQYNKNNALDGITKTKIINLKKHFK